MDTGHSRHFRLETPTSGVPPTPLQMWWLLLRALRLEKSYKVRLANYLQLGAGHDGPSGRGDRLAVCMGPTDRLAGVGADRKHQKARVN